MDLGGGPEDLRAMFYDTLGDFDGSRPLEMMYCPSARDLPGSEQDWLASDVGVHLWVDRGIYWTGYHYWALYGQSTFPVEVGEGGMAHRYSKTKSPVTMSDNSRTPLFTDTVTEWVPPLDYIGPGGYVWRYIAASHTRTRGTVGYQAEPPTGQNNARLDGSCAWQSYGENPDWVDGDRGGFGELEVAFKKTGGGVRSALYLWGGAN